MQKNIAPTHIVSFIPCWEVHCLMEWIKNHDLEEGDE